MERKLIEFELDGQPVYVEAEITEEELLLVAQDTAAGEPIKANSPFTDAVARIKPAAEVVLKAFKEMNTPDEIGMEFGLKFGAKAGMFFASADSEATFKVSLKWSNKK